MLCRRSANLASTPDPPKVFLAEPKITAKCCNVYWSYSNMSMPSSPRNIVWGSTVDVGVVLVPTMQNLCGNLLGVTSRKRNPKRSTVRHCTFCCAHTPCLAVHTHTALSVCVPELLSSSLRGIPLRSRRVGSVHVCARDCKLFFFSRRLACALARLFLRMGTPEFACA